jgi:hypothetical protein
MKPLYKMGIEYVMIAALSDGYRVTLVGAKQYVQSGAVNCSADLNGNQVMYVV